MNAQFLVCRIDTRLCAIPVAHVVETMRPLAIEPLPEAPPFVLGLSLIRGIPTPVIDGRGLLGSRSTGAPSRLVTVRAGDRYVALAVDETVGLRELPSEALPDAPPLVEEAMSGAISAIGTLDRDLLLVIESARLVPERLWTVIEERRA